MRALAPPRPAAYNKAVRGAPEVLAAPVFVQRHRRSAAARPGGVL